MLRVVKVLGPATVLSVLLFVRPTNASECKETAFGKCYTVHGRYAIYSNRDAIWPVGTHRLLSTTDPELDKMLEQSGWEDHVLFGDFFVCPTSPYKRGEMQAVCVEGHKNIHLAIRK